MTEQSNIQNSSCPVDQNRMPSDRRGKRRGRVQFCDIVAVRSIRHIDDMDDDIKRQLYCSSFELQKCRNNASKVAQHVYDKDQKDNSPQGYSFTMWQTYKSCVRAADANDDDTCNLPTTSVISNMERWVKKGGTRRGLEKWSIPALNDERQENKRRAISLVVKMQSKVIGDIDLREQPEVYASVYEKLSRSAKIYARLIAEADAKAAKEQRGTTTTTTKNTEEKETKQKREELGSEVKKIMEQSRITTICQNRRVDSPSMIGSSIVQRLLVH